jgi:hypothetical protein
VDNRRGNVGDKVVVRTGKSKVKRREYFFFLSHPAVAEFQYLHWRSAKTNEWQLIIDGGRIRVNEQLGS